VHAKAGGRRSQLSPGHTTVAACQKGRLPRGLLEFAAEQHRIRRLARCGQHGSKVVRGPFQVRTDKTGRQRFAVMVEIGTSGPSEELDGRTFIEAG